MSKEPDRSLHGEIILPNDKIYPPDGQEKINPYAANEAFSEAVKETLYKYLNIRHPPSWGNSLLAGSFTTALSYVAVPFSQTSDAKQIVGSLLVGGATVATTRDRRIAALAGAYVAWEFVGNTAATYGVWFGTVAGVVSGAGVGFAAGYFGDGKKLQPMLIGTVAGGLLGYFSGGPVAEVATIAIAAAISYRFNPRKMIGLVAATAIGYFGATTLLKQAGMETTRPAIKIEAPQTAPKGACIFTPAPVMAG